MNKKNPRILLGVTDDFSLRLLKGLPERLSEQGWEVHVVANGGQYADAYQSTEVTLHKIIMARKPSPFADLRALRAWARLIKELAPDLVLVGTPKAALLGTLASWLRRVPRRIYHLRGLRLETIQGLPRIFYWGVERLTLLLSTRAIAVSSSLRQKVTRLKLVDEEKITVLGPGSSNGVDTDHFKPSTNSKSFELPELLNGVPVIGFVGRITKDKGSEELAAASHLLYDAGVEHQLLIVGPNEGDDAINALSRYALGNPPVYTGVVNDTAPYYGLMDVLCLPTHREGFPNVVLEAGASGVATVTTDATGAVDSVIEGLTGKKVRVGDEVGLARVLQHLLTSPQERKRLGTNARQYVEKHFAQEVIQNELIAFLCGQEPA